jgi:import inner membrane translocase subunit TIM44
MDPNILHFEDPVLLLAQVMDKMPPVFLVRTIAHQVNCIRNKAGEVTEGSPGEIRTVIYMMAFQQEVDDDLQELTWKIVEFGVHPLEARFI